MFTNGFTATAATTPRTQWADAQQDLELYVKKSYAAVEAAVVVEVLQLAVEALLRRGTEASDALVVFVKELDAAGLALLHGLLHHGADPGVTGHLDAHCVFCGREGEGKRAHNNEYLHAAHPKRPWTPLRASIDLLLTSSQKRSRSEASAERPRARIGQFFLWVRFIVITAASIQ